MWLGRRPFHYNDLLHYILCIFTASFARCILVPLSFASLLLFIPAMIYTEMAITLDAAGLGPQMNATADSTLNRLALASRTLIRWVTVDSSMLGIS